MNVDFHSRHSLSAGVPGASLAPMRLRGLPWTRFSRRGLEHPIQSTLFKNSDGIPFVDKLTYSI